MEDKTYTCAICGKQFSDTLAHIMKSKQNILPEFIDEHHKGRFLELENGVSPKPQRCYCGGTVVTNRAGESSWETICEQCGMIYDED